MLLEVCGFWVYAHGPLAAKATSESPRRAQSTMATKEATDEMNFFMAFDRVRGYEI